MRQRISPRRRCEFSRKFLAVCVRLRDILHSLLNPVYTIDHTTATPYIPNHPVRRSPNHAAYAIISGSASSRYISPLKLKTVAAANGIFTSNVSASCRLNTLAAYCAHSADVSILLTSPGPGCVTASTTSANVIGLYPTPSCVTILPAGSPGQTSCR